ncbi:hypothetical protein HR060_03535 [Catenovulum sp. SM1970]|uniref:hypothetical protein n=1 Tax=Marinifaba aquimaris TaxID=2741323 RepID=UPI001574928D|nr:hypothetical protein [Marinifaba aquimaris]NTS75931.1 hypothetical protein [Marinifaba aquimaris]
MSFFKSIFGKKEQPRHLTRVQDLKQGDAIGFSDSFALPEQLRKQNFTVAEVNTYQYQRQTQLEFVLQGNTQLQVFLSVEEDDETWLNISVKITRDQVETLFDIDNFIDIFDGETPTELALQTENTDFASWLAPVYFQHAQAVSGYFYRKDFRPGKPPVHEDDEAEPVNYYGLTSADEKFSIDIDVWENGETDVVLTMHRPVTDISDLYPGTI